MSLNIKNPETHALVAKLAKRKGQYMTQVITDADTRACRMLPTKKQDMPGKKHDNIPL